MSTVDLSTDPRVTLDALYRAYRADVYRLLLRDLGSPSDADDCTQTVFLSALRALDRGCRPRAARAWLLAIATNVSRKAWRDRSRSPLELGPDAVAGAEPPDERRRELFAVLETLPPAQRTALVLHELCGLEYAEISRLTDQTVTGVETSVFRARTAVRTAIRGEGALDHDAAAKLLRRLVAGKLTRRERESVQAHVRRCEECSSAEAGLRERSGRRRLLTWAWWLVPTGIQRLLPLVHGSPARGLGAVACAVGLAGLAGDGAVRPARPAPVREPAPIHAATSADEDERPARITRPAARTPESAPAVVRRRSPRPEPRAPRAERAAPAAPSHRTRDMPVRRRPRSAGPATAPETAPGGPIVPATRAESQPSATESPSPPEPTPAATETNVAGDVVEDAPALAEAALDADPAATVAAVEEAVEDVSGTVAAVAAHAAPADMTRSATPLPPVALPPVLPAPAG
jgi:RNA polymerase sigma factor (sigma-70 family)